MKHSRGIRTDIPARLAPARNSHQSLPSSWPMSVRCQLTANPDALLERVSKMELKFPSGKCLCFDAFETRKTITKKKIQALSWLKTIYGYLIWPPHVGLGPWQKIFNSPGWFWWWICTFSSHGLTTDAHVHSRSCHMTRTNSSFQTLSPHSLILLFTPMQRMEKCAVHRRSMKAQHYCWKK